MTPAPGHGGKESGWPWRGSWPRQWAGAQPCSLQWGETGRREWRTSRCTAGHDTWKECLQMIEEVIHVTFDLFFWFGWDWDVSCYWNILSWNFFHWMDAPCEWRLSSWTWVHLFVNRSQVHLHINWKKTENRKIHLVQKKIFVSNKNSWDCGNLHIRRLCNVKLDWSASNRIIVNELLHFYLQNTQDKIKAPYKRRNHLFMPMLADALQWLYCITGKLKCCI